MKRSAMGTNCEEMSLSVTLSVIARVADSKSHRHRQSYQTSYRVSGSQCIQVGMSNCEQQRFFISYFN